MELSAKIGIAMFVFFVAVMFFNAILDNKKNDFVTLTMFWSLFLSVATFLVL